MVKVVGFEPTKPKGNGFTVHRNTPTLPHRHIYLEQVVRLELTITGVADLSPNR